ncbi:MAG: hypothetical protein ACI87O_001063 [Planctomycetota bacterium]|jgi:hypothetical protein
MDELDQLLKRRAQILIIAALGFAAWQGSLLAADLLEAGTSAFVTASIGVSLGALVFAGAMVAFQIFGRKVSKLKACSVIDDELTRQNRYKAFAYGWIYTLAVVSLGLGVETIWPGTAFISQRIALIVSVSVPMVAFGRMELKNMEDA